MIEIPTITQVVEAIDIPVNEWRGNCYSISCEIVRSGIVDGDAVYGMYIGKISPHCPEFAGRPFTAHGWISRPETPKIVDPTRWVFEAAMPYIWASDHDDDYDHGGNKVRMMTTGRPCPEWDGSKPMTHLNFSIQDDGAAALAHALTGVPPGKHLNTEQCFWLANTPPEILGEFAGPIYAALIMARLGAAIPIDNRRAVMGGY